MSKLEDLLVLTSPNGFEGHPHKQFTKNHAIPLVYTARYDRFVTSKQVGHGVSPFAPIPHRLFKWERAT